MAAASTRRQQNGTPMTLITRMDADKNDLSDSENQRHQRHRRAILP